MYFRFTLERRDGEICELRVNHDTKLFDLHYSDLDNEYFPVNIRLKVFQQGFQKQ